MKKDRKGSPLLKKIPGNQKNSEYSLGFFAFLRARNPRLFAHHPDHPAFSDHVWEWKGLTFCKGCTMTFAGIVAGGILYALTGWLRWFSDVQKGLIFLTFLSPSVISALFGLPRSVKHASRFLLGVLLTSAAVLVFITDSWAVRLSVIGVFLAVRIPLERKRRKDNETLMREFNGKKRRILKQSAKG